MNPYDFQPSPDLFSGQNQFAQNPFSAMPSFGGISPIGPLLQTHLQGITPTAPQKQPAAPDNSAAAMLGLLGLMRGGAGPSGVPGAGGQGDALTNTLPGLIGMTSIPAALMSFLYRSGAAERGGQSIGEHVISPLANFGGSASASNQVNQITNTLLGGNSGNAAANTLNLAQMAINAHRGGALNVKAMPLNNFTPDILRQAGATDAELRAWGVI